MASRTRPQPTEGPTVSRLDALARAALAEIAAPEHIGAWIEDHVRTEGDADAEGAALVDVVYANEHPGYQGWTWVVTVAEVPGETPTVLELGPVPADGALLAPEWIPWSVRLAEWEAQQAASAEAEPADGDELAVAEDEDEDDGDEDDADLDDDADGDELDDDEDDDDEELDEDDDFDEDDLHGDDGVDDDVDIDGLDQDAPADED